MEGVNVTIRAQNLETIHPIYATFTIHQTGNTDDLKNADIGKAVSLTGDYEIGPTSADSVLLGKLIALTLTDADDGERLATIQIGGICTLPISTTYPGVGDRIVGGTSGTIKQAPALTGNDPAGGNVARGTVIAVNGTTECTLILN
jgi:predicted RecA/RadA family phage recombinase